MGRVNASKLRDKAAAFDWYLQAFEVDPRAEWVREQAERLARHHAFRAHGCAECIL